MSPAHRGKFVAYYRVSTERQGASGLGLEAQQAAVRDWLNGGSWSLVGEYTDIETGKNDDRPELAKALAMCRKNRAKLIIAKLDRLSRRLSFVSTLMDSGVEFIAVDNPHANKLTIHILAAVAEHEREQISARTKAALQAAKARGVKLGGPRLAAAQARSCEVQRAAAVAFAANVMPVIRELQAGGVTSRNAIAAELNRRGVKTARGGAWTHGRVGEVLARVR